VVAPPHRRAEVPIEVSHDPCLMLVVVAADLHQGVMSKLQAIRAGNGRGEPYQVVVSIEYRQVSSQVREASPATARY